MKSIKNRVALWQMTTGKTKDYLCNELGISKTAFYSKLSGLSEFTLQEARKLSLTLGCTVDELFIDPVDGLVASA